MHICAAYGHKELIAIFLEKSKQNVKDVEAAQSATVEGVENKSPEESTPADVLNIDVEEWNHSLSPLQVQIRTFCSMDLGCCTELHSHLKSSFSCLAWHLTWMMAFALDMRTTIWCAQRLIYSLTDF